MARRTLTRPPQEYTSSFMNYLVDQIESMTGLAFTKGERIEVNGVDSSEIVLVSPNGTKYKIEVNDAGAISTTTVA
jgi:hypothetical protein